MKLSTPPRTEIDIRVAQELKNNQDFIYQTNQSLQRHDNDIREISNDHDLIVAKFGSATKEILIDFENHSSGVNARLKKMETRLSEFERLSKASIDSIQARSDEACNSHMTVYEAEYRFNALADWAEVVNQKFEKLTNAVAASISTLEGKMRHESNSLKDELSEMLVEEPNAKNEINDTISAMRVDLDGLKREIHLVKKDYAYDEKKIENLYTQIERLKNGGL